MTARHDVSPEFLQMISGYGLTTAQIVYQRPGVFRGLIAEQEYIWQNYDIYPRFPSLHTFLQFWEEKLEGPLRRVRVTHSKLIKPAEFRAIDGVFRLH